MPLVLADRVRDTTTTTGTGTVTLSGTAPTGYQSFAVIGNGNTTYYTINAGSQWEVGIGTYSSTGPTLARNTVLESSNSNALVDFAAGTKDVFVTYPADKSVNYDENNNVGIGTTSPGSALTVARGAGSGAEIAIQANGNSAAAQFVLSQDSGSATYLYNRANQFMSFGTNNTERMRINNDGNVAIGTSSFLGLLTVGSGSGASTAFQYLNAGSGGSALIGRISGNNTWFVGDTNAAFGSGTGLVNFAYGANPILFATNSSERMRITSAGDVGIGTSSPTRRLSVAGTANAYMDFSASSFRRYTIGSESVGFALFDDTAAAYRMVVNSSGNVGIGTTAPATRLSLGTGIGAKLATYDSGGVLSGLGVDMSPSSPGYELSIFSGYSGGNGIITFGGYNTASSTFTERMRIDNAGNVGIGTTSPDAKLDILGTSSDQLRLRTAETEEYRIGRNASTGLLDFYGSQTGFTGYTFGGIDGERMRITAAGDVGIGTSAPTRRLSVAGTANAYMDFSASSFRRYTMGSESLGFVLFDDTAAAYRMVVNSSGNVGIGTTSPARPLDVNGSIRVASTSNVEWGGDANYITGSTAGLLAFATAGSERMRITSAGNVGIGTTTPAGRVHAFNSYSNSSDTTIIAEGNIPGLNIRATGGGRFSIISSFGATNTTSFAASTGTNNPTEVMRIDNASGAFIIGTGAPNAAAQLQVDSVLRGFLPPRMTTAQRDAITTPPDGLMLYNTTTNKLQVRAAGAWVDLH